MEFDNIAVSGRIAVGATTLASSLSDRLGWPLRDASQMFRDVSMQIGYDLEKDPQRYRADIDRQIDRETRRTLRETPGVVVASKLAGFLSRDVERTLRVLVTCPLDVRVARYAVNRGYKPSEARKLLDLREAHDRQKWELLYGPYDFFNPGMFYSILQSDQLTVDQEVDAVLRKLGRLA